MAREVLWAPWRMTYIDSARGEPEVCIFCDRPARGDRRENLVLHADEWVSVMLNRYPYNSGHLMVSPRSHTADFSALGREEFAALMEKFRAATAILREALSPDGMNVGANLGKVAGAGFDAHLHWHIVPRWNGDTNFMPVVADVKVMPQHLLETYDRLAPRFAAGI
jgi:ATP adenylyltransferase